MIIVAAVKYALLSMFKRTVNIWCAQTMNRRIPIPMMAQIIRSLRNNPFSNSAASDWEIIPNRGSIRMYTSGWRKNQNKCWNKIGSRPRRGSKKDVLKFLSKSNIVIARAKTGNDIRSNTAVISIDHENRAICRSKYQNLMLIIVVIKLIAPRRDETRARWRLNIRKSTALCGVRRTPDSGGYIVHRPATRSSTTDPINRSSSAGGRSQKERLFNLGNAMSGVIWNNGNSQLRKARIKIGITTKNIISKRWLVMTIL